MRQIELITQGLSFILAPQTYGMTMNKRSINFQIGDEEAKRRLIADIAYIAAERRGFSPGYELDDWLQAEQEVEASMEALASSASDIDRKTGT